MREPPLISPRLLAMQLCYGLSWSTFLLLPKFLTLELSASPSQIGAISAIPPLTAALLVPLLGAHIDKVGRRVPIVVGTGLSTAYAVGYMTVDAIGPWLFALQLLQGVSFAAQFNGASALVADLAPRERMAQALGIFGAANVITNAIAPAITEPLAAEHGWSAAFGLSAGAGAIAVTLALSLPSVAPPQAADPAAAPATSGRRQLRYVLAMLGCGIAFGTTFTYYQPFAISLGMTEVGSFFIGFAITVVFVRLALGGMIDRVGRARVSFGSLIGYGLIVAGLTQLAPGTLPLFGALIGIVHGLLFPALLALAMEHADTSQRGRAVTYVNGGFQVGMTISIYGLGWVAELAGFQATFLVAAAIALAMATLLSPDLRSSAPATA